VSLNNPVIGEMSATPFVTSSNVTLGQVREISFPTVTRFFTLRNSSASTSVMAVAFTENGFKIANSNYFVLSGSESYTGEIRTDRIFLSGSVGTSNFSLIAGLTCVPAKSFQVITSSSGFSGVG
jgi:hypothetical protein